LGAAVFAGLLATGHLAFYMLGTVVLLGLSVPLCSRAEVLLGAHDPPSVVLDEIAAVPLCYLGWVILESSGGLLPSWTAFFQGPSLVLVLVGFALFRVLDALKPPPIGACQRLPSGWGIVADDVAAGLLTGAVVGVVRYAGLGAIAS
jgi:phosphatidylglycerophosphatase A